MFGLMSGRKSRSKAAFRLSNRILKLTSTESIISSQHIYGFVPTTCVQKQI